MSGYGRRSYGRSSYGRRRFVTGYAKKSKPQSRVYIPAGKIRAIARHAVVSVAEEKTSTDYTSTPQAVTDEGGHYPLGTNIAPGTGDSDRIGDQIYFKKFFGRYTIYPTSVSDSLNYNTFRVMLWRMKEGRENVNATVGSPLSDATPLQSLYTTPPSSQILTNGIPDRQRFMIYYDKTFVVKFRVGDASTGTSDYAVSPIIKNFSFNIPCKYQWSDSSFPGEPNNTTLRTHPVVFSMWSNVAGAVTPTTEFEIYSTYCDA